MSNFDFIENPRENKRIDTGLKLDIEILEGAVDNIEKIPGIAKEKKDISAINLALTKLNKGIFSSYLDKEDEDSLETIANRKNKNSTVIREEILRIARKVIKSYKKGRSQSDAPE